MVLQAQQVVQLVADLRHTVAVGQLIALSSRDSRYVTTTAPGVDPGWVIIIIMLPIKP
jgi:hypothetical protein